MGNFKIALNVNDTVVNIIIHASEIDNNVKRCIWEGATKHQVITIINNDTHKCFTFDHYGVINAKMVEDEKSALNALDSVLLDAFSYYNDDFYFSDEDLDRDDCYSDKVYNGCKKAYYKVVRWLNKTVSLDDFSEAVREAIEIL